MTTLADRPNTALVVIDLQNEVVANAYRRDEVLDTVNTLIARARSAKVPVVWIRHADEDLKAGSEAWQIVAELVPAAGDAIVETGVIEPGRWQTHRDGCTDGHVRSLDTAWRTRTRL
jgi:nicotinamidase-related amidase